MMLEEPHKISVAWSGSSCSCGYPSWDRFLEIRLLVQWKDCKQITSPGLSFLIYSAVNTSARIIVKRKWSGCVHACIVIIACIT